MGVCDWVHRRSPQNFHKWLILSASAALETTKSNGSQQFRAPGRDPDFCTASGTTNCLRVLSTEPSAARPRDGRFLAARAAHGEPNGGKIGMRPAKFRPNHPQNPARQPPLPRPLRTAKKNRSPPAPLPKIQPYPTPNDRSKRVRPLRDGLRHQSRMRSAYYIGNQYYNPHHLGTLAAHNGPSPSPPSLRAQLCDNLVTSTSFVMKNYVCKKQAASGCKW